MNDLILARALHVLAVVIWIGGVSMVTTIVLPAERRKELGAGQLSGFRAVEHRFVWQARAAVLLVAATGFYMVVRLDLWNRFRFAQFWWMHAMVGLWLIFALALFVLEPLFLQRRTPDEARRTPEAAMARLQRVHLVLFVLALITIAGAVAGSHGWVF